MLEHVHYVYTVQVTVCPGASPRPLAAWRRCPGHRVVRWTLRSQAASNGSAQPSVGIAKSGFDAAEVWGL